MNNTLTVISIAGAVTVGAISPGPSFLMVARTAVASSRSDGLAAATGMGVGAMLFSVAALLGLSALFAAVPWLYIAMQFFGGAYLMYLGYKIFRGAKKAFVVPDGSNSIAMTNSTRSFLLGLSTQVSNPKTVIVYTSIFAALLPHEISSSLMLSIPIVVLLIESSWYVIVAMVLSAASPRDVYLRYKAWVDRTAGGVMMLLGLKLISSTKEIG
ncbi:MAG TPA: LysE family transporter [Burkholderiaceae bacterium]